MTATRTRRISTRRSRTRKRIGVMKSAAAARRAKASRPAKPVGKAGPALPEQILYRFCKAGWAVVVEKTPNAQGTRFVCPFCTISHRVPGPVRGFRKVRRAQWIKFRRVEE